MYGYMYGYMYGCMDVCMYVCMYGCMYVCMYGWMYVCMYVCICTCVCIYIYTCTGCFIFIHIFKSVGCCSMSSSPILPPWHIHRCPKGLPVLVQVALHGSEAFHLGRRQFQVKDLQILRDAMPWDTSVPRQFHVSPCPGKRIQWNGWDLSGPMAGWD